MSLEKTIMTEMKAAMKAKDKTALEALRAVKSALINMKTSARDKEITETDEISLLQKQVKLRRDAAEQYTEQNRPELAENEINQIKVIERFLPEQMDEEAIKSAVVAIIQKTGAKDIKDMGKVMGMASSQLAGKADGKAIANEVKNQLNS